MTPPPPAQRLTVLVPRACGPGADIAGDVRAGLTAARKRLPCVYFYDEAGSALFEEICETPEYYLTRTETAILRDRAAEIAARLPAGAEIVELGSGSARKTRLLLDAFLVRQERLRYRPIDVSRATLQSASLALLAQYPALEVAAIAAEYHAGLAALPREGAAPRLVLWLGSNIGNFDRAGAAAFLRRVGGAMDPPDRLLVGVDLRKDPRLLEAAYDDARGVTARFNLNLLARLNAELAADFDLAHFRHRAVYLVDEGRIEMYLVSTRAQRVTLRSLGLAVDFAGGEAVHTEDSYKYSREELGALAAAAGLGIDALWTDERGWFADVLFALPGPRP